MPCQLERSAALRSAWICRAEPQRAAPQAPDPKGGQGQGPGPGPEGPFPVLLPAHSLGWPVRWQLHPGSWDSSCLPGLAADLLSQAEFPFWEERRVIHVQPHTRVSQEKEKVQSPRMGMAQLPGGREMQGVPNRVATAIWL